MPTTLTVFGSQSKAREALTRLVTRAGDLDAQALAALNVVESIPAAESGLLAFLAASSPVDDLNRTVLAWHRSVSRALERHLGSDHGVVRAFPRFQIGDSARGQIDGLRSLVQTQREGVSALLAQIPPEPASQPTGGLMPFEELRSSGLIAASQLTAYLKRMSSMRTREQASAAIGASKELVEAVLRAALLAMDSTATPDHDFPRLAKQVRNLLDRHLADAGQTLAVDATKQMLAGFASLENGLSALRNELGSGHGKASLPVALARRHALLAADVAHAHTRWVVLTLRDLGIPHNHRATSAESHEAHFEGFG